MSSIFDINKLKFSEIYFALYYKVKFISCSYEKCKPKINNLKYNSKFKFFIIYIVLNYKIGEPYNIIYKNALHIFGKIEVKYQILRSWEKREIYFIYIY